MWLLFVALTLGFSSVFAKCVNCETQARIHAMEESIARSEAAIQQLLKEESDTVAAFEKTKKLMLKQGSRIRRQPQHPFRSWRPSLGQLDFTRYPPSPFPNYFKYRSIDGLNELEFHGWLQVDEDIFLNSQGLLINNGVSNSSIINKNTLDRIWVRRLRPTIEGDIYRYFNFLINPDFGQGQIRIFDALIDINYYRILGFQAGLQMSLLSGIENYFENFDYLARAYTMEMSYTAMLAPDREFGFVLHGSLGPSGPEPYFRGLSYLGFDDFFSYQLGIFSGTADNSNPGVNPTAIDKTSTDESSIQNKAFEGRIYLNPFIHRPQSIFHRLGFGFAASTHRAHLQGNLPDLVSLGQNVIFFYQPTAFPSYSLNDIETVVANGLRTRLRPQAIWGLGPLGLMADWGQTLQNLVYTYTSPQAQRSTYIQQKNHANQVQLIYNLTQEDFNLFHLQPNRPFHFFERGAIGAWQLVLRYSGMSLDPRVFQDYYDFSFAGQNVRHYLFSDPRTSVQSASSFSLALNWFWNSNLRFTLEYDQSSFTGGCSTGALNAPVNPGCLTGLLYSYEVSSQVVNRPTEKIIMQRFQLTF